MISRVWIGIDWTISDTGKAISSQEISTSLRGEKDRAVGLVRKKRKRQEEGEKFRGIVNFKWKESREKERERERERERE